MCLDVGYSVFKYPSVKKIIPLLTLLESNDFPFGVDVLAELDSLVARGCTTVNDITPPRNSQILED